MCILCVINFHMYIAFELGKYYDVMLIIALKDVKQQLLSVLVEIVLGKKLSSIFILSHISLILFTKKKHSSSLICRDELLQLFYK
jgi:hypothetical protein